MNKAIYKPVIRSIKKQLNKNKIMAEAIDIRELNERIERRIKNIDFIKVCIFICLFYNMNIFRKGEIL